MALSSRIKALLTLVFLITMPSLLSGQEMIFSGIITDTAGIAIQGATVFLPDTRQGTVTGDDGRFALPWTSGRDPSRVIFSCIGYRADTLLVGTGDLNGDLKVILAGETIGIEGVQVKASGPDNITIINIPAVAGAVIPSVTGGIETVITTLPGVASFSELSSSYSVRGGSYDENLVYINDVEVYKPYLIRAGQQEGLSRINPDLTASVRFSPGGFSASYGDRMSSVLDITYREPERSEGSVSLSLLTSSVYAGARSSDNKLWFIAGARYRTNAILLRSLDTRGDYNPRFADIQAIAGYRPDERTTLTLSLWGSSNRYSFIPRSQTTTFGTVDKAYRLYAFFEGGERDRYDSGGGAITLDIMHNTALSSKFILSAHLADEGESYDIRGAYSLSSLDLTEGTENNPDTLLNAGLGSWLMHARNRLRTGNTSLSYRGSALAGRNSFEWGVTAKHRSHDIALNEWLRVDSAGYTVGGDGEVLSLTSYTARNSVVSSFVTEGWLISRARFTMAGRMCDLNAGIRSSYDTYNSELLISPRISLTMALSPGTSAYIAGGAYHQPPGGREMMLETDNGSHLLKAQRSYHLTAGVRYDFIAWERPFRFTAEAYGKLFDMLIPYTVDNVTLMYFGGNIAEGYAAGVDMRVNGEFVAGVESWFSLSVMKSEMKIPSSNSGWYPAPFDQRVNFSIFFQDYLPGHPDLRAHINIAFGTGIPTSPPESDPWDVWFRMPPYRRIDIGFSKVLIGPGRDKDHAFIEELIAGIEIYNLADIRNTISYTWIRTVRNRDGITREFAVPNYLTSRSLNLKLTARF
ncbi:MAG: carboxypeptidase-like regulatory domain-containing protein [Bacteroidales bacterium]|nr:carboxypeptidase-like regulatory domain-containing protein [Bacteroidales bacterium]